jgi:hypothetical protein
MVHLGVKNKLCSATCTSIIDKFAYCSFNMSFNISSQGVIVNFHTLGDVSMGGKEYSHKQIMGMF